MRTAGALVATTLLLLLLAVSPASAAPATPLCEPDVSRGAIPEVFAVDACVDATGLTMRNTLDAPVVVRSTGDLGSAVRVRKVGGRPAEVIRLADGTHDVLMPGDVVRWPLGAGAAEVAVTGMDPATIPAIADALAPALPRPGDAEARTTASRGFAALVRVVAAAVEERGSCLEDKNFLGIAACDTAAADTIGRAVSVQLPRTSVAEVVPLVLDPARWDEWAAVRPAPVGPPAERTLRLASAPLPPPVPAPAVAPPAAAPAPVPVPAPIPAPVPAPVPAALPALPAPAPAQVLPALPSGPGWPPWDELVDRNAGPEHDNGNGRGNGHGKGRGNGHGGD